VNEMKRDEIIKLAREASGGTVWWPVNSEILERFAALVAAAEREACAQVCVDAIASIRGFGTEAAAKLRRLQAKTEDLEGAVDVLSSVVSERNRLEAQRDELLKAIKSLIDCINETRGANADKALERARDAIAKATGEAA
jgi:ABC-type transporter Mla subunit MlaD